MKLSGGDRSVNRELEAKARGIAGLKAYITNIDNPAPEFVIGAYHQLWRIEQSFRMPHGRSTTANATPSRRTWQSCSPRWPSPGSSRTAPAGRSTVRTHHPPLPHPADPRRPTDPHRRGPAPG